MKYNNYEITKQGEIISSVTGRCLAYHADKKGYQRVVIKYKGEFKTWLVHRLIATMFIPNPDNLPQVNHLDGNKSNNAVSNLEWTTGKKNVEHSVATGLVPRGDKRPNAKFSDDMVRECRALRKEGWTYYKLSDKYGASYQGIQRLCARGTYSHVE